MKKTKSKKKKNNFKPTKPLIIIVSVVILLFVLRLLYLKIIDMKNRAWQKDYGITDEANPEGLTYEEFNASLLPEHQQEPGMREYLNDCPWLKADAKDPYSMDIYITTPAKSGTGGCNRETHVEKTSIIIQNHDFEEGVQEFKAWLKKNKLKLGKDVIVEDFYPYTYGESTFAKFLLKNNDWNNIDVSLPIIKGEIGTPREIIEVQIIGSDREKIIKEFDSFVQSLSNEHVYMYYGENGPTIEYK